MMLRSFLNSCGLRLRSGLRWRRGAYSEQPEPMEGLLFEVSKTIDSALANTLNEREAMLRVRYGLDELKARSTRMAYLEALTCLDYLDEVWTPARNVMMSKARAKFGAEEPLMWLDVGSKNGVYLPAMAHFAERLITHGLLMPVDSFAMTGLELDAYRMYGNFYTRIDYTEGYCKPYTQVRFEAGDVLEHTRVGTYDVITSFLPFVFKEPLLAWGLPMSAFSPERYLAHVIRLLRPGGVLFIVNQGKVEAEEQERLLESYSKTYSSAYGEISYVALGQMPESFVRYKYPRMGWWCQKKAVVQRHKKQPELKEGLQIHDGVK